MRILAGLVLLTAPHLALQAQGSADTASKIVARADSLSKSPDPTLRRQAIPLRRTAAALLHRAGENRRAAHQWRLAGQAFFGFGQADSALIAFRSGLSLVSDTEVEYVELLIQMGETHDRLNQNDSALIYMRRAVVGARATKQRRLEGLALGSLGGHWSDLQQTDSAIPPIRASMTIAAEVGDSLDEALAANSLGLSYRRISQFDSALVYYHRALTIVRAQRDPEGEAFLLNNIGSVLWAVGRTDSALALYQASLQLRRASGDRFGIAQSLNNIASVFDETNRVDSALVLYRESLRIRRELNDRAGVANSLNNIGRDFMALGQLDSAQAYHTQAIELRRATGNRAGEAVAMTSLASVYRRKQQLDSAAALFQRALAIQRSIRDLQETAQILRSLAVVNADLGGNLGLARAAAYYDSAAAVFSEIGLKAGNDPNRVSLAEEGTAIYHNWTLLSLARQTTPGVQAALTALAVADQGRAQGLLDLMRTSAPGALSPGKDLAAEAVRLIRSLPPGTAAIVYLATRDTLLSFVVSPQGTLAVHRRAISLDTLRRVVQDFRSRLSVDGSESTLASRGSLEQGPLGVAPAPGRRWENDAMRLAEILLPAPVLGELAGAVELLVVPQGPLTLVPFAALPIARPFAIRYGPSLATVGEAEARPVAIIPGESEWKDALVVGNPPMPEVTLADGGRSRLTGLPGAEGEARAVAMRLHTQVRTVAATEQQVRQLLPRAPLVHFASHGFAYSHAERVRDSFIALGPGDGQDGRLTVGEVLDDSSLTLRAELVVLSACQTGLGNLRQAEGTVGLQRAFLARGARSVLVSLWNVSDVATQHLMTAFYRHWLDDADRPAKAEALRRAQEEVRQTPGFEHPRFWAAFQLVGAR